ASMRVRCRKVERAAASGPGALPATGRAATIGPASPNRGGEGREGGRDGHWADGARHRIRSAGGALGRGDLRIAFLRSEDRLAAPGAGAPGTGRGAAPASPAARQCSMVDGSHSVIAGNSTISTSLNRSMAQNGITPL